MDLSDTVDSLEVMSGTLTDIIAEARAKMAEAGSVSEFAAKHVSCLGKAIGAYGRQFKKLNIQSRSKLDDFCKKNYQNRQIQDSLTDLDQAEYEWKEFLMEIDHDLRGNDSTDKPNAGDHFTLETDLIDVRSEESISSQVLAKGVLEGAKKWLEETQCTFRFLLDPSRKLYKYVGLNRSLYKTWSIESVTYYAEQIARGRQLPKSYTDIEDDPHQMGGDFILNELGNFSLVYCSTKPSDRPEVSLLLNFLQPQTV